MLIAKSVLLFVMAGLAEIGGGYMMWLWLRRAEPILLGVLGGGVLVLYGVIPTFQPAHFGRVYAAYGGVFVVMSLLWSWIVDKRQPDLYDVTGGLIVMAGVAIIMYWPRGGPV
ncbi:MAG: YnfA family protein [Dehalococcoidia bacterium]